MRKIELTEYEVEDEDRRIPYNVKLSLENALYSHDLHLTAQELLNNDRLAQKIKKSTGSILLEESEYEQIRSAFMGIKGFTKNDVELVNRVLNAVSIEVTEK